MREHRTTSLHHKTAVVHHWGAFPIGTSRSSLWFCWFLYYTAVRQKAAQMTAGFINLMDNQRKSHEW